MVDKEQAAANPVARVNVLDGCTFLFAAPTPSAPRDK